MDDPVGCESCPFTTTGECRRYNSADEDNFSQVGIFWNQVCGMTSSEICCSNFVIEINITNVLREAVELDFHVGYNTIFKGTEARGEGPIGWEHWKPSDQHPEVYPRPRRQKLRTGGPRVRPEVTGAPRLRQQCEQNQRGFGGYCIEAVETVFMLCFTLFSINNIYIFLQNGVKMSDK